MPGRQANILTLQAERRMLDYARRTATPLRDQVIVLLSVKAGLRAAEIAKLEWPMVLDARGRVGRILEVRDRIAKRGSGRRIPLHPQVREALVALHRRSRTSEGPLIRARHGGHFRPNSIVNWFVAACAKLRLDGCSSHSGRRTRPAAACAMCRSLPVTDPSKPPRPTSTATPRRSGASCG
jgi:integrase/recombinase XerD